MYDLPQRTIQHLIDEKGVLLLKTILPIERYIYREIGARDYGIDAILEVVEQGNVTAKMISLQLKSSTNFSAKDYIKVGIKRETCNYWFQHNLPVLLVLADVTSSCLYYTDAKKQIRQRYDEFLRQQSFSFFIPKETMLLKDDEVLKTLSLDVMNKKHHLGFVINEILMTQYTLFENALKDFITNRIDYYEHIAHQHADPFLTQDYSFYNKTCHIQSLLQIIAFNLFLEIDNIDFPEVHKKCEDAYVCFNQPFDYEEVIEYEITILHQRIQKNIETLIDEIRQHVTVSEKEYWCTKLCRTYHEALKLSIEEFKQYCGW